MNNKVKYVLLLALFGILIGFQAQAIAIIDQSEVDKKFQDFENVLIDNDVDAAELELGEDILVEYELPSVSLLPTSKVYFLKIWYEKIRLLFTLSEQKKADYMISISEKRLAEADKMYEMGKQTDEIFTAVNSYQVSLGETMDLFSQYNLYTTSTGIFLEQTMERFIGQEQIVKDFKNKMPEYQSDFDKIQNDIQGFIDNN